MKVKDIMKNGIEVLNPESKVSEFISIMEKERVYGVPVVNDKGQLEGFVYYKKVAEKNVQDPTVTKVKSVMIFPPKVYEDDDVETAAEILFDTGFRVVPVIDKDEKVVGTVSVIDILKGLEDSNLFKAKAEEVMTTPVEVIHKEDDIGKARYIMREKGISTLPVVDDEGKLVGVVSILDLLKAVQPKERISWYSMAAEKLTTYDVQVSTIMNDTPVTGSKEETIKEIIDKMRTFESRSCIIVDKNKPIGIVTTRDILELYITNKEEGELIPIQYSGLEGDEDEFVMETVDRMVQDTVEKIHSIYPVQYFHIHFKTHKREGERKLYSVRARIMTDKGVFISKAHDWDIRDAVGQAMDKLEKIVIKHKEKEATTHRPRGA